MTGKLHISSKIFFLSFFVFLTFAFIGGANAQNVTSYDIVTIIEQRTGIKLPVGYTDKIRNFTINNKTLQKEIAAKFTKDFIVNEMQSDRGISKENQLLFIYCAIGYNYNQDFYTGDDGDNNRMSEFEKAIDFIEDCQKRYEEEIILYMQKISAEADKEIAEADKEIAEADKEIAEALNSSLENLVRFYNRYKKDPSTIKNDEVTWWKEDGKRVVYRCKKAGIDPNTKLTKEMLKFYGVE